MVVQDLPAEMPMTGRFRRFSVRCLPARLPAEPIDTTPRLPSRSNPRVQELPKPQHPKKLLDQERACPELVETVAVIRQYIVSQSTTK